MQTSDWVLISTTLFLGAMALLAPYIIERWKYKFYSAELAFDFFHKPPYCHKTKRQGEVPVYYFRFRVFNEGRTQAEQCEVVLENIWKENSSGELKKIRGFSPVPLKWSGLDRIKYLTIQPGRRVFCDIGFINHPNYEPPSAYKDITENEERQNKFFFEFGDNFRFYSQWDCLIPGRHRIEIAIYSKNSKRVSKKFSISWSGIWKDRESEMLNELAIS